MEDNFALGYAMGQDSSNNNNDGLFGGGSGGWLGILLLIALLGGGLGFGGFGGFDMENTHEFVACHCFASFGFWLLVQSSCSFQNPGLSYILLHCQCL